MLSRISKLLLIRDNEKPHVMYFFILYVILGCGFAFGRNSTDVLFFKRYGIEYLPFMYVALSFFLALVSIVYSTFADRISPERLSIAIFTTLIVLLVVNWAWINFSDSNAAYPAYFLLYEAASEILLIHSVHYLSQNFDPLQAKRLYPLIMAGTQVGIITGSIVIAVSARYIRIQEILLVWCVLLAVNSLMIYLRYKKHGVSAYFRPIHKSNDRFRQAVSQLGYGFSLMKSSQMLRAASFALFFMVITFYILCYSVNRVYTHTFSSEAELSSFFGTLTATTNGIALLLQIFATNRIIHRFGVKKVNMFFPLTSIVSYITLLSNYSLGPAILGSINKDAIMPAFRNPVRTIFFNTLPDNVQGRARATSVVIVLPLALFVCGLMLILMQKIGTQKYFLTLGMVTAGLYLYCNHIMNKAYIRQILTTLKSKVLMPTAMPGHASSQNTQATPQQNSEQAETLKNSPATKLLNILMDSYPEKGHELISLNAGQQECNLTDQLIHVLRPINPPGFSDVLWEILPTQTDARLRASILKTLFSQRDPRVNQLIPELLGSDNLRLQCAAIIGALQQDNPVLQNRAIDLWQLMIQSGETGRQMASLDLLEYLALAPNHRKTLLTGYKQIIRNLLNIGNAGQKRVVLTTLLHWPEQQFPEIAPQLIKTYQHANAQTRILCVKCSRFIYETDQTLLHMAIEDSNTLVRLEAARMHSEMAGDDAKDIFAMWLTTEANGSPLAQGAYIDLLHEISSNSTQFEQIALVKAELAQHFFIGYQILERQGGTEAAAYQLVKHILRERVKQYIELAVHAIQGYERDEDTRVLSTCIKSRDTRHIANACEVLRNFKHRRLGEMLSDLVDQKPVKFNKLRNPRFADTATSVLSWCKSLPDPWLSLCAKEALKSLA